MQEKLYETLKPKQIMRVLILFLFILTACNLLRSEDKEYHPEIVFSTDDGNGTSQIYTMNEDGSNVTKLTNFGTDNIGIEPAWSPDGEQIVFSTTLQSSSNGLSLYIMEADGSNMHPMHERENSHIPTPGNHAKWSPDGSKIIFQSCVACQVGTNIELFIYDFVTDSIIQLTDTDYAITNTNPVWRPDGSRIAFVSNRDYINEDTLRFRRDLYVMNSDGSNLKRVTETGYAREPVWHPEEDSIVFRSTGDTPGLYKISLQDSSITTVKEDTGEKVHLHPHNWFGNGNKLLITIRDLSRSGNNSIMIYDLTNKEEQTIYSGSPIDRADWIIN